MNRARQAEKRGARALERTRQLDERSRYAKKRERERREEAFLDLTNARLELSNTIDDVMSRECRAESCTMCPHETRESSSPTRSSTRESRLSSKRTHSSSSSRPRAPLRNAFVVHERRVREVVSPPRQPMRGDGRVEPLDGRLLHPASRAQNPAS